MAKGFPEVRIFPSNEEQDIKGLNIREYLAVMALQGVIIAHGANGIAADAAADKTIEYTNALLGKLYDEQFT